MRLLLLAPALLAAACHQTPSTVDNQAAAASSAPASTATPANAPDLSRYVGKYPTDAVRGVTFLAQPLVQQAVAKVVPDPAIRALVLGASGPTTPIVARDGQLLAWGCEAHNCGPHNWSIQLQPDGGHPQVCYKPDGDEPKWYPDTPVGAAKDACPSGG